MVVPAGRNNRIPTIELGRAPKGDRKQKARGSSAAHGGGAWRAPIILRARIGEPSSNTCVGSDSAKLKLLRPGIAGAQTHECMHAWSQLKPGCPLPLNLILCCAFIFFISRKQPSLSPVRRLRFGTRHSKLGLHAWRLER